MSLKLNVHQFPNRIIACAMLHSDVPLRVISFSRRKVVCSSALLMWTCALERRVATLVRSGKLLGIYNSEIARGHPLNLRSKEL